MSTTSFRRMRQAVACALCSIAIAACGDTPTSSDVGPRPPRLASKPAINCPTSAWSYVGRFDGIDWCGFEGGSGPQWNLYKRSNIQVTSRSITLGLGVYRSEWTASLLCSASTYAGGIFEFRVNGPGTDLDPNLVLAMYLDDIAGQTYDYHEIDFEFATWGNVGGSNLQYVVWPDRSNGSKSSLPLRWRPNSAESTHRITWRPGKSAELTSFTSRTADRAHQLTNPWTATRSVPSKPMNICLSVWLIGGNPKTKKLPHPYWSSPAPFTVTGVSRTALK